MSHPRIVFGSAFALAFCVARRTVFAKYYSSIMSLAMQAQPGLEVSPAFAWCGAFTTLRVL
jgi:hypothetical protein